MSLITARCTLVQSSVEKTCATTQKKRKVMFFGFWKKTLKNVSQNFYRHSALILLCDFLRLFDVISNKKGKKSCFLNLKKVKYIFSNTVQSAMRLHVVIVLCLSVCLYSVSWKPWKLVARTISPTPSLFVTQRPSTHSQGNMAKFGEGWEKVACWSTKAAVSLKRVKIEETLLWRAYRNSPTLFRTVPFPTPPLKFFRLPLLSQGAWAYPGTVQIFWAPPIILGTGKD